MTTIPTHSMLYAVYWPNESVLKVGRAWKMSRLRGLMRTGAQVVMVVRDRPAGDERAALASLRGLFERAFFTAEESLGILTHGRGFTECFVVPAARFREALATIFRGIANNGHDPAEVHQAGAVSGRGSGEFVAGGSPDSDRLAPVHGRRGAGVSDSGDGEGGSVAVGFRDNRGRRGHTPARTGRDRISTPVRSGSPQLPATGPAGPRGPRQSLNIPAPTPARERLANESRSARGSGGRGRESERGRVGVGERGPRGVERRGGSPLATPSGQFPTFPLLPCTPRRNNVTLQELRYSQTRPRTSRQGKPRHPHRTAALAGVSTFRRRGVAHG